MKRRTFLAGLAAIAVSSKLPPLPIPPATPTVLPPVKHLHLTGASITAPGGWCAPLETVWHGYSGGVLNLADHLPEIRMQRGGIQFTEVG